MSKDFSTMRDNNKAPAATQQLLPVCFGPFMEAPIYACGTQFRLQAAHLLLKREHAPPHAQQCRDSVMFKFKVDVEPSRPPKLRKVRRAVALRSGLNQAQFGVHAHHSDF